MHEADLKMAKGRLDAWKNKSKKKDLVIAEQSLELNILKPISHGGPICLNALSNAY